MRIFFSGDQFSKSDLNCCLCCIYELQSGGRRFARIMFLSSFFFFLHTCEIYLLYIYLFVSP